MQNPYEANYIIADCGCEVYAGEHMYSWLGEMLCPDHMKKMRDELSLEEFADLIGCEYQTVHV